MTSTEELKKEIMNYLISHPNDMKAAEGLGQLRGAPTTMGTKPGAWKSVDAADDYKQILEKAIQKAIDGGWRPINAWVGGKTRYEWRSNSYDNGYAIVCKKYIHEKESEYFESAEQLIFNHDFAKALWGKRVVETRKCDDCGFPIYGTMEWVERERAVFCPYDGSKLTAHEEYVGAQPWAEHLQQMVIAEDPIKYLGDNI